MKEFLSRLSEKAQREKRKQERDITEKNLKILQFLPQYQEPHVLELDGGEKLDYTVIRPLREGARTEWIVIVGGFSATKEMWKPEMLDLAVNGKRVVFVCPDKGVAPDQHESTFYGSIEGAIPDTMQWKAAAVKKLIDHLGITEAHLIGQSQGAPIAASVAALYPKAFKRVLLDNPAGINRQSVVEFYGRAVAETMREMFEKLPKESPWEKMHPELAREDQEIWDTYKKKKARHHTWRLTKEVPDIARADMLPVLKHIQDEKREAGGEYPFVILLNANHDLVFDSKGIEERIGMKPPGKNPYIDSWIMYADKNAQHSKYHRPISGLLPEVFYKNRHDSAIIHALGIEPAVEIKETA